MAIFLAKSFYKLSPDRMLYYVGITSDIDDNVLAYIIERNGEKTKKHLLKIRKFGKGLGFTFEGRRYYMTDFTKLEDLPEKIMR